MDHIGALKPDRRNARRHSPRNTGMIESSIQRDGFGRSVLIANDGTIIAGNATIDAAAQAGIEDLIVVETDGTKVVAVKRTDVEPGSERFHKLALADNRAAELAEWDPTVLEALAAEMDLSGLFREDELADLLAGLDESPAPLADEKYTAAVETPLYEPTGACPAIRDLTDTTRRDVILTDIDAADLPAEVAAFLRLAAERHTVFDYRNIAEFYAHADAETQRLMEDSALVIIDVNRAIELGYAKLREALLDLREEAMADG